MEEHLAAIIARLEAARRVQAPDFREFMISRPEQDGDQQLRLLADAWDQAAEHWRDGPARQFGETQLALAAPGVPHLPGSPPQAHGHPRGRRPRNRGLDDPHGGETWAVRWTRQATGSTASRTRAAKVARSARRSMEAGRTGVPVARSVVADPAGERDGLDQVGRQGAEDLVQGAERDAGDEALVGLADLALGAGHGVDGVPRLDVAVGADRGHHLARRELQVDREAAGLRERRSPGTRGGSRRGSGRRGARSRRTTARPRGRGPRTPPADW